MLEIRNRKILLSKINLCKSDVIIGDCAHRVHHTRGAESETYYIFKFKKPSSHKSSRKAYASSITKRIACSLYNKCNIVYLE